MPETITKLTCPRPKCKHEWFPRVRVGKPAKCPKCQRYIREDKGQ